jgi:hypothetical protein
MSEYPYQDKIRTDDIVNCKSVFSSDGAAVGEVEAALADSFIVKAEEGDTEIKYEIPRLIIDRIVDGSITLKQPKKIIQDKYETSSIKKNWE